MTQSKVRRRWAALMSMIEGDRRDADLLRALVVSRCRALEQAEKRRLARNAKNAARMRARYRARRLAGMTPGQARGRLTERDPGATLFAHEEQNR